MSQTTAFDGLNDREHQMARCLAHIAPMVCFHIMRGAIPEGQEVADCSCLTCSARNTLENIFGQGRAIRMMNAIQAEKRAASERGDSK